MRDLQIKPHQRPWWNWRRWRWGATFHRGEAWYSWNGNFLIEIGPWWVSYVWRRG